MDLIISMFDFSPREHSHPSLPKPTETESQYDGRESASLRLKSCLKQSQSFTFPSKDVRRRAVHFAQSSSKAPDVSASDVEARIACQKIHEKNIEKIDKMITRARRQSHQAMIDCQRQQTTVAQCALETQRWGQLRQFPN
mmetsp:Transcript_103111/g.166221  ORF Transcript_103111/g.166221 Transcript_103111/m.166221 type:complete len:140 (+) Transcript_103111:1-420(+)